MADSSFKGLAIGGKSLETDESINFAARYEVEYICPNKHVTILPFSAEAEVPPIWECYCGKMAYVKGNTNYEGKKKHNRSKSHWEMLIDRRSEEELKETLNERLKLLESGKIHRGL
ncbi:MAG: RNA polymerase-binding protein RbpA [Bifidobacteriaceae bacterium]|jgi:hypothetical protein|nr:RNA polymerase-binding protein RbpA [Bifidobacteriaceae bacterium]